MGYRFHPTDEEIIRLLEQKRREPDFSVHAISEANICDYEPFQLTSKWVLAISYKIDLK